MVGPGIEPEDPHRAGVGAPVALERLDRRGLAGAVRAEEGDDFARVGVEAHTVDGDEAPVTNDEVSTSTRAPREATGVPPQSGAPEYSASSPVSAAATRNGSRGRESS